MKRNPEREAIIFRHWKNGRTIDEINAIEGIPRSSIGHYVRKFNEAGINRDEFKTLKEPEPHFEIEKTALGIKFINIIIQEIKNRDFLQIKEIVESYFALEKFLMRLSENFGGGKKYEAIYSYVLEELDKKWLEKMIVLSIMKEHQSK